MNKIRVLPDNLSNQIAAGEVVERPASVVKELLENSLDAGAKRLQIEIELGGRRLIRVTDDGEGMVRDDAVLAFERHATSKIETLEDLSKIKTLGFRGEALASIASVAKVELVTKFADETVGTRIYIEGGRLVDVKDAARPTGTTVAIRDLFFNTPARRKFMRSEATENYHLTSIVTHYALANPAIAFTLINNGREVLRVSPAGDLRERAFQIFGANLIESLLPVAGGREFVAKITGFVSAPRERRTTRDAQYFFINGRFVRDKIIAGGLLEGFRAVLPHGVYPVAFLFLEIPLEEVDVNVHPAKTEVRFRRAEAVKEVIGEAIRGALQNAGIAVNAERGKQNAELNAENRFVEQSRIGFQIINEESQKDFSRANLSGEIGENENIISEQATGGAENVSSVQESFEPEVFSNDFEQAAQEKISNSGFQIQDSKFEIQDSRLKIQDSKFGIQNAEQSADAENLKTIEPQIEGENSVIRRPQSAIEMPFDSAAKLIRKIEPENLSAAKIRPVGQLHESYIIAMDDEGLLLVDQHVAHERILFDKFRKRETERPPESQNLLLPETFDLTPAQAAAFDFVEAELENLGFALMRLSGRTIAVKAVPSDLPPSEARNLLAEVLDTVEREKFGAARDTLRDHIAASLACKAAVKVNMKLTPEKMQWLIDRLLTTSSPTTCPHGRPVILRLTMRDIERGFHRI